MKSYEQFIETVVNRMVKDALSPKKKTAELELAADAEPSVSDLRKQADMLCQKMDEATNTLIAGLTELGLYPAQKGTKTAEKQPVPGFVGPAIPPSVQPYWDYPRAAPKEQTQIPETHSELLELMIKLHDPNLHDELYANRELGFGGLTAATAMPPFLSVMDAASPVPTPLGTPAAKIGLGLVAGGARAAGNNSNVVSQQLVKHQFLKNENAAKKINELAARDAVHKANTILNQLADFFKSESDAKVKTRKEMKQQYHDNVISAYADSLKKVQSDKNIMMPELNAPAGQTASVAAATAPFWGGGLGLGLSLGSMGFNAARAAYNGRGLSQQIDKLHKDKYAPNLPTTLDFLLKSIPSSIDSDVIAGMSVEDWRAYVEQRNKNNGTQGKTSPTKAYVEQVQKALPNMNVPKNLTPIGNTPESGIYATIKGLPGALTNEAKKYYDKLPAFRSKTPDYDALKLRTQYPSGANK
jgi:hypothetical protein